MSHGAPAWSNPVGFYVVDHVNAPGFGFFWPYLREELKNSGFLHFPSNACYQIL